MVRVRVRCLFHAVSSSRLGLWENRRRGKDDLLLLWVVRKSDVTWSRGPVDGRESHPEAEMPHLFLSAVASATAVDHDTSCIRIYCLRSIAM